jgi:hypothetical protein
MHTHTMMVRRMVFSTLVLSAALATACAPSGDQGKEPAAAAPAPAAAPAAAPAPAADAGPTLNIRIEGANAHVISLKHNSLEFGPMKGGGVCGNDEPHELWLLVPKSLTDVTSGLPEFASGQYATFRVYRLTGLTGSLEAGDTGKPALPPLALPNTKDQLSLVPDLAQLVADPRLDPNWRDKLSARFVLRGGMLNVQEPEEPPARTAIWEFKASGHDTTGLAQNITDHISYTRPLPDRSVTLAFSNGKTVAIKGDVVNIRLLTATASAVKEEPESAAYQIGEAAHEYCRFYDVLRTPPPMSDRPLPVLKSVALSGGQNLGPRPGKYCGGARYVEHP